MIICKICNNDISPYKELSKHLRYIHKINSKDYYDQYISSNKEHKCIICNKETRFKNIIEGYFKTCSHKCHAIFQNNNYSEDQIEIINKKRQNTWKSKNIDEYKQLQSDLQHNRWNNYTSEYKEQYSKNISNGWKNRSEEDKQNTKKIKSKIMSEIMNNRSKEDKLAFNIKISQGLKKYYKNMTKEEKELYDLTLKKRLSSMSIETIKNKNKKCSESLKKNTKRCYE